MPKNNLDPELKGYPQEENMSKEDLEQLFTAIQERFSEQDKLIQERFSEQDKLIQERFSEQDKLIQERFSEQDKKLEKMQSTLQLILNIVQSYDQERKEVKSTLWEFDRRLLKLERRLV